MNVIDINTERARREAERRARLEELTSAYRARREAEPDFAEKYGFPAIIIVMLAGSAYLGWRFYQLIGGAL